MRVENVLCFLQNPKKKRMRIRPTSNACLYRIIHHQRSKVFVNFHANVLTFFIFFFNMNMNGRIQFTAMNHECVTL